jgi:hypothetical protein
MVGPTFPLYEAYNPGAAQLDSEHVFQLAWNDIVTNGMAPEAAADKALKRTQEIFAKYPIPQSWGAPPPLVPSDYKGAGSGEISVKVRFTF